MKGGVERSCKQNQNWQVNRNPYKIFIMGRRFGFLKDGVLTETSTIAWRLNGEWLLDYRFRANMACFSL
ncbi:Uncharacterized protein TCM_004331 [Theobroma cacao]|uniref:Uncharacterized protein n=1 Tax=Theobroma cacao TaxID=3641 RepID=A0A061DPK5_THECC|nr:Uncharacterized protein TCM_004331 [Theobroma cacao]